MPVSFYSITCTSAITVVANTFNKILFQNGFCFFQSKFSKQLFFVIANINIINKDIFTITFLKSEIPIKTLALIM